MPLEPNERLLLEFRLSRDLSAQSDFNPLRADLGHLQQLEARIQETAKRLEPDAPANAILATRRKHALRDLARHLVRRSNLPAAVTNAAEHVRVRSRWQETRILELARQLNPENPRLAIDLALPHANVLIKLEHDQSLRQRNPSPNPEAIQKGLAETARQMKRRATFPQATRQQRVHQVLGDLRRLDLLQDQARHLAETRRHLLSRGSVVELEAMLQRVPVARDHLEESATLIYCDPDRAIEGMREQTRNHGLRNTVEHFRKDPAFFGRLRGVHTSGLGDSPGRRKVLDRVSKSAAKASSAIARRDLVENELEAARSCRQLQNENRELARAYPSREKLLTDLGRHMEGLEIHEVRPLLRPGQARLVQDLRKAELTYLNPLREAGRRFRSLEPGGIQHIAHIQKIAGLFQGAPRHILRRLTPPQIQTALVATAIAKRVVKAVAQATTRAASL